MQNKTKSVHFASQETKHTIPSLSAPKTRILTIEDETQSPSTLEIPEKSMRQLTDSSNLRTGKQLKKLAKDGVIFLRASKNNSNEQRLNALSLRNMMFKLLAKYQFVVKVPHPNYDASKKTAESNGWIPNDAIKPKRESLKAVFVGSVGCNEPKWRSFWEWNENENNTNSSQQNPTSTSIAPESQSSLLSPPHLLSGPHNNSEPRFSELSDAEKKMIYDWAVNLDQTVFIKNKISQIFNNYALTDNTLDWNISIVNPLWFRIQNIGSILHTDIPYIFGHTNLLKKISGQKLLISGIDMVNQQTFIGKKSKILKQKLSHNDNKCPLCSYQYNEGDNEAKQLEMDEFADDNDRNKPYHNFCEHCCDSQYGIYTVWTALDYFDTPFNSGSIVFALGSHNKYSGHYTTSLNNVSVPSDYSQKSMRDKQSGVRWAYMNDIKPGDMFIFNVKTLHAAGGAKDGYLRMRMDTRVAVKVSDKRYLKELNEIKSGSRLGLSQLQCLSSQPVNVCDTDSLPTNEENENENDNESVEFNTSMPVKSKHLSFEQDNYNMDGEGVGEEGSALKRSVSVNDMENMEGDKLKVMDNNNISVQDLPTQDNDSPDLVMNEEREKESVAERAKALTPDDVIDDDKNNKLIPSPPSIKSRDSIPTPQSVRSLGAPIRQEIHNNNTMTVAETQYNDKDNEWRQQRILPSETQIQQHQIPRLEDQTQIFNRNSDDNNNDILITPRKRLFSGLETKGLSQEKEKANNKNKNDNEPAKKRQKISNFSTHGVYGGYNMNNIRHFTTMSDEELCRKISVMRNKMNRTFNELQTQVNESMDLMEVANERYLYSKEKEKQERERANHFQQKNQNLQKKLIENHNMLFKMFE